MSDDAHSTPEGIHAEVAALATRAKAAARHLARANTGQKNQALRNAAAQLVGPCRKDILEANGRDMAAGAEAGLGAALVDRLLLTEERLQKVADAVLHIAELPDPVGTITDLVPRPSGIQVGSMTIPLGLVSMIYESRPNVTADASALCIKSGNACLLRGGKEAFHSNHAIARAMRAGVAGAGLPEDAVSLIATTDRRATDALLELAGTVDLVIPRGGEALIRHVVKHATMPVIQHFKGVCHLYVDGDGNQDDAIAIALNSKVQRPGVCNALETLLVDRACAETFVPRVVAAMLEAGVEIRADKASQALVGGTLASQLTVATEEDWDTEYLDKILALRVVDGIDGAMDHIAKHGSFHTEAIVTESHGKAQRWLREVDASMVVVNASTRFNDGGEIGLGAEIGISTTKLHAYGPMGLNQLCARKWVALGNGTIRQ